MKRRACWNGLIGPGLIMLGLAGAVAPPSAMAHEDEEGEYKGGVLPDDPSSGPYVAQNLELMSVVSLGELGATSSSVRGNDIWGWTDPLTGHDYALMGMTNQTAFVDVTDPGHPLYLGALASHTGNSAWRDVKVYQNYAYIVSDLNGSHGMQVFDLTRFREHTGSVIAYSETAHYSGFTKAHNIVINEDTGYAYAVGTNTFSGGLHAIDLSDPTDPTGDGGFGGDGYTHDAQVVSYHGPDGDYAGREIAFSANEDTVTVVDVTDKASTIQVSRTDYGSGTTVGYIHQGWLTDDHRYFLSNDELDERNISSVINTRTHIWDMADLDDPLYVGFYESPTASIDHNLYVRGDTGYLSNYTAGLRVVDLSDIGSGTLTEVASLDTYPANDGTSFNGAWSVYPYFDSGTIVVSDINDGLFVLRHLPGDADRNGGVTVSDLAIFADHFGEAGVWDDGDFDRDGWVGVTDLAMLALKFGTGHGTEGLTFEEAMGVVGLSPGLLPEPGVGVLVVGGLVGILGRRRE